MHTNCQKSRFNGLFRVISLFVVSAFIITGIIPAPSVYAQELNLPVPGTMVNLSPSFEPAMIQGIKISPNNPLLFNFLIDPGQVPLTQNQKKIEYHRLISYFLAALTTPEKDMWVNLSPYEHGRIISLNFGHTQMGRDMLAQDYILKQLSASLVYPENGLGKKFWDSVYEKMREQNGGIAQIPVNTFNKVWIVPDSATVFEKGNVAIITQSHLKVLMEEDYLSLNKHDNAAKMGLDASAVIPNDSHRISSQVMRQIIIPAVEQEINEGKNFAQLRQMYNSMILAAWFKKTMKMHMLSEIYVNKNKSKGVELKNPQDNERIYQRYIKAYKKGVYNYIKEETDPTSGELIPRKYFSGGVDNRAMLSKISTTQNPGAIRKFVSGLRDLVPVNLGAIVAGGILFASVASSQAATWHGAQGLQAGPIVVPGIAQSINQTPAPVHGATLLQHGPSATSISTVPAWFHYHPGNLAGNIERGQHLHSAQPTQAPGVNTSTGLTAGGAIAPEVPVTSSNLSVTNGQTGSSHSLSVLLTPERFVAKHLVATGKATGHLIAKQFSGNKLSLSDTQGVITNTTNLPVDFPTIVVHESGFTNTFANVTKLVPESNGIGVFTYNHQHLNPGFISGDHWNTNDVSIYKPGFFKRFILPGFNINSNLSSIYSGTNIIVYDQKGNELSGISKGKIVNVVDVPYGEDSTITGALLYNGDPKTSGLVVFNPGTQIEYFGINALPQGPTQLIIDPQFKSLTDILLPISNKPSDKQLSALNKAVSQLTSDQYNKVGKLIDRYKKAKNRASRRELKNQILAATKIVVPATQLATPLVKSEIDLNVTIAPSTGLVSVEGQPVEALNFNSTNAPSALWTGSAWVYNHGIEPVGTGVEKGTVATWDGGKWVYHQGIKPVGEGILVAPTATWDGTKWIYHHGVVPTGKGIETGAVYTWDGTKWVYHHGIKPVGEGILAAPTATWDGTKWIYHHGIKPVGEGILAAPTATWDGTKWIYHHGVVPTGKGIEAGAVYTWDGTKWVYHHGIKPVGEGILAAPTATWDGTKWVYHHGVVPTGKGIEAGAVYTWDGTKWVYHHGIKPVGEGILAAPTATWDGTKWVYHHGVVPTGKGIEAGAVYTWDGGKWVYHHGIKPVGEGILAAPTATWDGTKWIYHHGVVPTGKGIEAGAVYTWDGTKWVYHHGIKPVGEGILHVPTVLWDGTTGFFTDHRWTPRAWFYGAYTTPNQLTFGNGYIAHEGSNINITDLNGNARTLDDVSFRVYDKSHETIIKFHDPLELNEFGYPQFAKMIVSTNQLHQLIATPSPAVAQPPVAQPPAVVTHAPSVATSTQLNPGATIAPETPVHSVNIKGDLTGVIQNGATIELTDGTQLTNIKIKSENADPDTGIINYTIQGMDGTQLKEVPINAWDIHRVIVNKKGKEIHYNFPTGVTTPTASTAAVSIPAVQAPVLAAQPVTPIIAVAPLAQAPAPVAVTTAPLAPGVAVHTNYSSGHITLFNNRPGLTKNRFLYGPHHTTPGDLTFGNGFIAHVGDNIIITLKNGKKLSMNNVSFGYYPTTRETIIAYDRVGKDGSLIPSQKTFSFGELDQISAVLAPQTSPANKAQINGGIDFDSKYLQMNIEGDSAQMIVPRGFEWLLHASISGFIPKILDIRPGEGFDLAFFKGMLTPEEQQEVQGNLPVTSAVFHGQMAMKELAREEIHPA